MKLNNLYYFVFVLIFLQMFFFQLKKLDVKDNIKCLTTFKSNNILGLLVFFSLIIGKI